MIKTVRAAKAYAYSMAFVVALFVAAVVALT